MTETKYKTYPLGELITLKEPEQLSSLVSIDSNYLAAEDFTEHYLLAYVVDGQKMKGQHLSESRVESPCLLATESEGRLKVARISDLNTPEEGKIYVDRIPYFAFTIRNHNVVSEDYLLRVLVSDETTQQLAQLQKGETSNPLKANNYQKLLNLTITLPDLETQDVRIKGDMLEMLQEMVNERQQALEEYRKDIHLKKHAVGQTLFNLNNWWNTLMRARKEQGGQLNDEATTGRIKPITLKEIYAHVGDTLNILSNQIGTFTIGDGMEPQQIALATSLKTYIAQHQSPLFSFAFDEEGKYAPKDIIADGQTGIKKGDPLDYLYFPPQALSQILDNIVNNACQHGFKGRENLSNIIKISYHTEGSLCTLLIANNGEALQEGMNEEKVFMYGGSSAVGIDNHSGLGAFQVKTLMNRFGGDASIITHKGAEFPIAYQLTFRNSITYK